MPSETRQPESSVFTLCSAAMASEQANRVLQIKLTCSCWLLHACVRAGQRGREAGASPDGGRDAQRHGDPDDAELGVVGAGLRAGRVPGELPVRREHQGAAGPPRHRVAGHDGARALQAGAPPLLRARHGRRRLLRAEELHDRRLPQDDVEEDRFPQESS